MTISAIESIYTDQLPPMYDKDEAKSLALLAVQHVCDLTKNYILLHKSHEITLKEETSLIRILDELRFGVPLQYVLGEADFYGLRFKVNSSVLIPRPETEELVFWALDSVKRDPELGINVIDIGTGSGCIPIAIKKNLPEAEVSACDISHEAIEVAINNAVLNQTEVHFFHADILSPRFTLLPLTFNLIISNPPYITDSEKRQMHKNVLEHEPHTALFVPDDNPLLFYNSIADFAAKHLSSKGLLFLEINEAMGREAENMLHSKGFNTEHKKDINGKDRMIKAWLN
ncbi:peptide chain release factor N(5)-glutamine methyltransferase [Desertivirga xinjiangensis]|uniref:peptide chain release factor N(5)-glutamine methyltransferase n=1 Tax=Desertivirga xinjiangensis TaxID=539206 RepID=UPI00210916DC|nr:peptide chain release factor N(5)-glutamine methyltransferase [Pedobacter xinjiangensis]